MKNSKQIIINHLFIILFVFAIQACKNNTASNIETAAPVSKIEKEDAVINTMQTTLSAEQIANVGVTYGSVEQKQLTNTLKANGQLNVPNHNIANATSLYGGVIKSMTIHEGSHVRKGQLLATIANTDVLKMQEEYLQLKANGGNADHISTNGNMQYANLKLEKESLLPQIDYAKKEMARQKELYEGNAGARKNLEMAQSNLQALQKKLEVLNEQLQLFSKSSNSSNTTRIQSLRKQFQMMGINPDVISASNLQNNFYVTSPISGTISKVFAKIGSYIDVSSPVAEIVDNAQLHLELHVFEKDLPKMRVGQIIHFTLTNNPMHEYDAEVFSIGSAFENESKTISIHCDVEGDKTGLIDGMHITAIVSLSEETTAAVPNDAIVEADGKYYLFIVEPINKTYDKNTIFTKVEIVKGSSNIGYTAITFVKDVAADCKIVTKGAYFINAKMTNIPED
jgi:membrane fusion protein, heavy metal efflux system